MNDFWLSCGHHLLDRDEGGGLRVTNEFLKAYLARPELNPPPDACVAERTLHAAVLSDPRRPVDAKEIAAIADADARENWQVMVAFRDHLIRHKTIEAAYLALMRHGVGRTPPMFINQLVHVILRNMLDGCEDAFIVRAAELFFRSQRLTTHEGSLIAADEEIVEASRQAASPLVSMLGLPDPAGIEVLNEENAGRLLGAQRPVRHGARPHGRPARAGRAGYRDRTMGRASARGRGRSRSRRRGRERQSRLVCRARCARRPRSATPCGTAKSSNSGARDRIIGLFRLTFRDPDVALDKAKGEPIYLLMAMTPERTLRMKPQNLVTGLPIRNREAVS